MAEVLTAEKPYTFEKKDENRVIMHFKIHALPDGGSVKAWFTFGIAMILLGWIPGMMIASTYESAGDAALLSLIITWIGLIAIPLTFSMMIARSKRARGSQFTRLVFTRDQIKTTRNQLLRRDDIEGSFWRPPDTSFTYRTASDYKINKNIADHRSENANEVGVQYGSKQVMLTHQTLTRHQAQKIADAVAWWLEDQQSFFGEAGEANIAAE